jgi:hypothetical protein
MNLEDRWGGTPGTVKRYLWDRSILKLHMRDAFLMYLFWPLRLLPWGHIAANFWSTLLDEGWYGSLDAMSFCYFGDKYVVPLRDALRGKRHSSKRFTVGDLNEPYHGKPKYPAWYITRLVWPQFKNVYSTWRENR